MNTIKKSMLLCFGLLLAACGGTPEKKEKFTYERVPEEKKAEPEQVVSGDITDLDNKGIGPVKSLKLPSGIDPDMAARGKETFEKMCTACHKIDKKFVGPSVRGVTLRRAPEWVMNMILNPEEMIVKDPIAKALVKESNMAVMANQNLSEEEARNVLEYFRSLDN